MTRHHRRGGQHEHLRKGSRASLQGPPRAPRQDQRRCRQGARGVPHPPGCPGVAEPFPGHVPPQRQAGDAHGGTDQARGQRPHQDQDEHVATAVQGGFSPTPPPHQRASRRRPGQGTCTDGRAHHHVDRLKRSDRNRAVHEGKNIGSEGTQPHARQGPPAQKHGRRQGHTRGGEHRGDVPGRNGEKEPDPGRERIGGRDRQHEAQRSQKAGRNCGVGLHAADLLQSASGADPTELQTAANQSPRPVANGDHHGRARVSHAGDASGPSAHAGGLPRTCREGGTGP